MEILVITHTTTASITHIGGKHLNLSFSEILRLSCRDDDYASTCQVEQGFMQ